MIILIDMSKQIVGLSACLFVGVAGGQETIDFGTPSRDLIVDVQRRQRCPTRGRSDGPHHVAAVPLLTPSAGTAQRHVVDPPDVGIPRCSPPDARIAGGRRLMKKTPSET